MVDKRELICIRCPVGCHITAELEDGRVKSISGNSCPRGAEYAENEVTHPVRTVTSLVRLKGGEHPVVSVKTESDVPKEKMMDVVAALKGIELTAPVMIGDVAAEDIAGTGVRVIVTSDSAAV